VAILRPAGSFLVPHQATFALSPSSGAGVVAISRFVISSAVSTSVTIARTTSHAERSLRELLT
jgi:hypothetical protein